MKNRLLGITLVGLCHTCLWAKIGERNWVYSINERTPYTEASSIGKDGFCSNRAVHTCSVNIRITKKWNFLKPATLNIMNVTRHTDTCVIRDPSYRDPSHLGYYTKDGALSSWTTRSRCIKASGPLYECDSVQTSGSSSVLRDINLYDFYSTILDDNMRHVDNIPLLCNAWPIVLFKHTIVFNSKTGEFTLKWQDGRKGFKNGWLSMEGTAVQQ